MLQTTADYQIGVMEAILRDYIALEAIENEPQPLLALELPQVKRA